MGATAPRPKAEPSSNMSHVQEAAPNLRLIPGGREPAAQPRQTHHNTHGRKRQAAFKQADLLRAVRAAKAAGLPVVATVIGPDGSIRLEHIGAPSESASTNPFDAWEAKRARAA